MGETLTAICADESMPDRVTVWRWCEANEEFRNAYARARDEQVETFVDQTIDISDDARNDWMARLGDEDAGEGWVANGEHIQRSRLRVDTRKWVAAKLKPKKYGERQTLEHEGTVTHYVVEVPAPSGDTNQWLNGLSSGGHSPAPSSTS